MPRLPRGRRARVGVAGLAALVALGLVLAAVLPGDGPQPVSFSPDLAPLAADGTIAEADLAHDSRDDRYRAPGGAVPTGTPVLLRLRAAAGDLSDATLRVYDTRTQSQVLVQMAVAARDAIGGQHGYDYWQAELPALAQPTVLYYRFIVRDGAATRYLEDDPALDGGPGTVLPESADASWQLVVYQDGFRVPDWVAGATVYQIFPDRFANGDASNDPTPDATPGPSGAARYRYGDVYGNPILPRAPGELPEGYCRAYQGLSEPCAEQPLGRDFYGGDLAGITQHLPELAELGVTVIYLNPIFAAPSNHRYDTSDYFEIDPDLGTRADFDALLAAAHDLGLRVVLDGVFNHTSSDSPTFDRAHRFAEVGACEAADSPWAAWYTLQPGPPAKCFDGQTYLDWFGFDTLPVLTEDPQVVEFLTGTDGVLRHWLDAGIDGWRLDVMNEIGHGLLRALRRAAKDASPEALVVGEEWNDASPWLLGDQADGVMNYRFRRAVIGLVNGDSPDPDGAIEGLTPSAFASVMEGVREDYPPAAWSALLNLVDSHDTARILWTLTPGADNRATKEARERLAEGVAKLRQVAALQLSWPGMASIYYGDEVGLTGHDDPDDRRPYPWGEEDAELRELYAALASLRRDSEALRHGDLRFLLADDTIGVLAYARRTDSQAAVTVLNLSDAERAIEVPFGEALPAGLDLTGVTNAIGSPRVGDGLRLTLPPRGYAVLVSQPGADLTPPPAPHGVLAGLDGVAVNLAWQSAGDATRYVVWRSILAGGGYEPLATVADAAYVDRTARPGTTYHYRLTALDAAGNASPHSAEATALPQVAIADARLEGPERVEQTLSALDPGPAVAARVRVDGSSAADGPTVGILAQLGLGDAGSDPAGEGWSWLAMAYAGEADGADRYTASLRPEAVGEFAVALRVSTDGGASWRYADSDGIGYAPARAVTLVARPAADVTPPGAPRDAAAAVVSESAVTLVWKPPASGEVHRFEVWRAEAAGGPFERIGTAAEPTFTDAAVRGGTTYFYVITAQDASYNRSERSGQVVAAAESRAVQVTFSVRVPGSTPPGDTVYIAGDFQGWDPGATPMTRLDATTWTIDLPFVEGQKLEFKFTRGSWEAVEKDAGCGEIPNRSVTVVYGTDGTQAVEAEVGKWRDIDACG